MFEKKLDTSFLFWSIILEIVWVPWLKCKYLMNKFFQIVKWNNAVMENPLS